MVVVPAAIALTTPLGEIVATVGSDDVQGVDPSGPEPVKVEVAPTQALKVPEIVGTA